MPIKINNFDCTSCGETKYYTNFMNIDNIRLLSTACISCQSDAKLDDFDALQKKIDAIPKTYCKKCKTHRAKSQFKWISKNGKNEKIVKTCISCRDNDKRLKNCIHTRLKKNCPLCKAEANNE
jgi:hypothetical protein